MEGLGRILACEGGGEGTITQGKWRHSETPRSWTARQQRQTPAVLIDEHTQRFRLDDRRAAAGGVDSGRPVKSAEALALLTAFHSTSAKMGIQWPITASQKTSGLQSQHEAPTYMYFERVCRHMRINS